MAYQESAQSFVRALRAPTDPPKLGDPSKIEIATAAWGQTSFHVPRKAEIILEWSLTRLLKDGTQHRESNPVLDLRFWALLQGVLSTLSSESANKGVVQHTWLISLLNRMPLLPIVSSLLSNSLNLPAQKRGEIYLLSSKSLQLVWSLSAPKFSLDNLLECLGVVLRVLETEAAGPCENSGLVAICTLVTSSLRNALSHSSNKKKFSHAFMTSHINAWLVFISNERAACSPIHKEIRDLGVELLFNADSLRQMAEGPGANPLFDVLGTHISSSQPRLLSTLPFLMAAFTDAVKKRRSLLPSGSTSTTDAPSFAMLFFYTCEEILRSIGDYHKNQVWNSRLGLLKVVEDESLFSPRNESTVVLLKKQVNACVECLSSEDDGNVPIAVQCICVLSRIDHDLVEVSTGHILSKFLTLFRSPCGEALVIPANEFLSLALSFHMKTRTLPTHISRLMDSCSLRHPYYSSLSIRTSYDGLVASPALTIIHLNKLSMAVRTYITPGQTLDTARQVLVVLREIWERFRDVEKKDTADHGQRPRKKRRTYEGSREGSTAGAVTFMLAARIATAVLTSLPLHTTTEAEQAKTKTTVGESLIGFIRDAILAGSDEAISGNGNGDKGRDVWAKQVVAAAALRLRYMLEMSGHTQYDLDDQNDLGELTAAALKVDDCLPEYGVEIFRYLLQHRSYRDFQQLQVLLDVVLNFLETRLLSHSPASKTWLGRSSQLSFDEDGPALAAVALFKLLLDRNLEVVNTFASPTQQELLVGLLHSANLETGYEDAKRGLSLVTIVHECLHSANFWEQDNLRSSFFSIQHARTTFLDTVDFAKSQKRRASGHRSETQIREAVKAYSFLLYPSPECIPKSSRNDFIRRAVVLDILLGFDAKASTPRAFQVARTFLLRTLSFLGSWEHEAGGRYLHYLMTSPVPTSTEQITMDLVQGHLRAAFQAAVQGRTNVVFDAVQVCRTHPLGDWYSSKAPEIPLRSSTQLLMDIAMADFSLSSFLPDLADHLSSLFECVLDQLHPFIRRLASRDVTEQDELLDYSDVLLFWSRVIAFGRYLDHPKNPSPGLGTLIMQAVGPSLLSGSSRDPRVSRFGGAMHAVLISELPLFSMEDREDRESHLQCIITTYMTFAHLSMSAERCDLGENLAKLFRTLSLSEFSSCLQFVIEALISNGIASDGIAHLIRLISLALHNALENTLRIVQTYVKECLDLFVNDAKLSDASILRLPVLTFISDLCSKRPASIRPQNVISIWVVLSRHLAGSKAHDSETNVAVFHEIVAILSSLVRLRRDLVVTTLPHLSNIICHLLSALRGPRPLLGAKQFSIVADSLPVWVNPSRPLGAEESKSLSRLLTSLAAKTSVRVHGPSAELRKPESLARPLSKHVPCVLQAYLEALNDPLCVLPAETRRELQPGLFVLCDMLNEHTRDSLMVSALDAGGKAAMKVLWREYEKQRYTGKG
ncbi:Urb2/Npa2 family-domain-containing protein [Russula earlei]|uniref:Urb2/Npa2 family-domain-containing protein n=1 Tax=Russula earlei TaxID=71964 RepID=A0ACC0UM32_9AGAM|nr:Urb2/Npa2 family-domain-containing protein [Russula earlei]